MLFGGFCEETANIWYVLGLAVNLIKIIFPLVLIILGMLDLGKAVVSSDEKAINKSVGVLAKRFVAALVMFFIPTIVSALFNAITHIDLIEGDANICMQCLTNANGSTTMGTKNLTCEGYASVLNGEN